MTAFNDLKKDTFDRRKELETHGFTTVLLEEGEFVTVKLKMNEEFERTLWFICLCCLSLVAWCLL